MPLTAAVQASTYYADMPFTIADNGAGVCTLTTKNLGPQSQWALLPVWQNTALMPTGQTATLAATTPSGGAAPTVTTVVTTLGSIDCDYVGWTSLDATAITAIETYCTTQVGPLVGYRQQMILFSPDSYGNTVTTAQTNCNFRRTQVGWSETDMQYYCESLGQLVGYRSLMEDSDPSYPYNWNVLPRVSGGSFPDLRQARSALCRS